MLRRRAYRKNSKRRNASWKLWAEAWLQSSRSGCLGVSSTARAAPIRRTDKGRANIMKAGFAGAVTASAIAAASIAHAAAEGGEEAGGSWVMLAFFAINFAVFAAILVYYAAPMARKFFADRASRIKADLARVDSAFKEAQDLANRAAAKMAQLEAELKRLAEELEAETAFQAKKIHETAVDTAKRIKRDAEMTAVAIADTAQHRVRDRLAT